MGDEFVKFLFRQRRGGSVWKKEGADESRIIRSSGADIIVNLIKSKGVAVREILAKKPDMTEIYFTNEKGVMERLCVLDQGLE